MLIVWFLPNPYQLMGKYTPGISLYQFDATQYSISTNKRQIAFGCLTGVLFILAFTFMLING